jgi:hypothetical protein
MFGHADVIGHAAIDMDAKHADALAAIGLAVPARIRRRRDKGSHKRADRLRSRSPGPVAAISPDG